jgi:hypothetical protein
MHAVQTGIAGVTPYGKQHSLLCWVVGGEVGEKCDDVKGRSWVASTT